MMAISIKQPWAFLIVRGWKDIENRAWSTDYRGPLLIHASKNVDRAAYQVLPRAMGAKETGGIVGIAELVDVVTESASPWFEGTYGFVLRDARPLPFVALRGALKLFDISYPSVGR
jgi:hypothetical protein